MPQDISFDEIYARIDMKSFFATHGVTMVRESARKCYADCPFCKETEHRFGFDPIKGIWKCYKCQESGNAFSFLTKLGHNKAAAMQLIKEAAGIRDDEIGQRKMSKTKRKKTESDTNKVETGTVPDLASPVRTRIYSRVVELLPLTAEHRADMKAKRGFSDETVDKLKFRSCGPHAIQIRDKLLSEFTEEDLAESGVLVRVNDTAVVNAQLLEDRVLIPYLDDPGSDNLTNAAPGHAIQAYHLRPHKLGFSGLASEVYCKALLVDQPERIVLTEGEFKAAALAQWGVAAVAVPGISSFGLKSFDRLTGLLRQTGVKNVTVIFDNEVKDNPDHPNYKPKASDRYDTDLWAYLMAWKLTKTGFDSRVGRLPDEWREKGKIDFDMALAQGRTREDILAVIGRARPAKEYLEGLPDEGRGVVQRKISQHFAKLNIKRDWNKYVATRHRGEESYDETISNFVVNIRSNVFTPDGIQRNIQLINEFGETSKIFILEPGDMAGLNEFKKFCFAAGNYIFRGNTGDLIDIWSLEFGRDSGEVIDMPEKIGIVEKRLWMFAGVATGAKKDIFRPDNEATFWIGGRGYKPRSLTVEREKF